MPLPPDTVTFLTATALGKDKIKLTWVDAVQPTTYIIFRSLTSVYSDGSAISACGKGVQTFTDKDLNPGTQYFYWVFGVYDGSAYSYSGPVNATTTGEAGTAGVDVVEQIAEAMMDRCSAFLSSDFKVLPYLRELERNENNLKLGYGVLPKDGQPGPNAVLGSYCLTMHFELILFAAVVKKNSEAALKEAEFLLESWADRAAKDFKKTKLYLPNIVLNLLDHSVAAPEHLTDNTRVALRVTFPVVFRQSFSS